MGSGAYTHHNLDKLEVRRIDKEHYKIGVPFPKESVFQDGYAISFDVEFEIKIDCNCYHDEGCDHYIYFEQGSNLHVYHFSMDKNEVMSDVEHVGIYFIPTIIQDNKGKFFNISDLFDDDEKF